MGNTKLKGVPAIAGAAPPPGLRMGAGSGSGNWLTKLASAFKGKGVARGGPPAPVYEKSCVTQQEAEAFAAEMIAQGYHAVVEYNDYDYSWSVEVFDTPPPPRRQ